MFWGKSPNVIVIYSISTENQVSEEIEYTFSECHWPGF